MGSFDGLAEINEYEKPKEGAKRKTSKNIIPKLLNSFV